MLNVAIGDGAPAFLAPKLSSINLALNEIDAIDTAGHTLVVSQYASPLIVDVLQYQDGAVETIGQATASLQTFRQIRFIIDVSASSVRYSTGASAPLNFVSDRDNSDARAGRATRTEMLSPGRVAITVSQPFSIGSDASDLVNVDFNLLESLSTDDEDQRGARHFDTQGGVALTVRPALFVAPSSNGGQITGTVVNDRGRPVSNAVVVAVGQGGQVGNTIATDASGNFRLHTLGAGVYRLDIYNEYTNSAGAHFSSDGSSSDRDRIRGSTVIVTPGQLTNAGTITD